MLTNSRKTIVHAPSRSSTHPALSPAPHPVCAQSCSSPAHRPPSVRLHVITVLPRPSLHLPLPPHAHLPVHPHLLASTQPSASPASIALRFRAALTKPRCAALPLPFSARPCPKRRPCEPVHHTPFLRTQAPEAPPLAATLRYHPPAPAAPRGGARPRGPLPHWSPLNASGTPHAHQVARRACASLCVSLRPLPALLPSSWLRCPPSSRPLTPWRPAAPCASGAPPPRAAPAASRRSTSRA